MSSLGTVDTVLKSLVDRELVYRIDHDVNGVAFVDYAANLEAVSKIEGVAQNLGGGTSKIEHINTIEKINNNNNTNSVDVGAHDSSLFPEDNTTPAAPSMPAAKRFVAPKPEDVTEYAASIGFALDGAYFVDYYASRGWMIGKNHMKDWKAAVRTWKNRRPWEVPARPAVARPAAPARENMYDANRRALEEALGMNNNNPYNNQYDEQ